MHVPHVAGHLRQITANLVEGTARTIERSFDALGVRTQRIQPFPGHRYCNKIQQLRHLATTDATAVVLLDSDTFVTAPIAFGDADAILGKMVDWPNPPIDVLQEIFKQAGVRLESALADIKAEATARANFNGGLYVIPRDLIAPLHGSWEKWAHWCLASIELFQDWSTHVDQVSFALAVADLSLPTRTLPRTFNFPTNHGPVAATEQPIIVHYHNRMDDQLFLLSTGEPIVDEAIASANQAIRQWRSKDFPNALFWTARYSMDPLLGSGVGSRGELLEKKRGLIAWLIKILDVKSLVDIGGGCLPGDENRRIDATVTQEYSGFTVFSRLDAGRADLKAQRYVPANTAVAS